MNRGTLRERIDGPAGALEVALDRPAQAPRGIALVAHPHPLHGGTLDNKVAQTLARAWVQLGYLAVRPNFRGVGASQGSYDAGRGETDDLLAALRHYGAALGAELGVAAETLPLALAGFSFGSFVATSAALRLRGERRAIGDLTLIGPAVATFPFPTLRDAAGAALAQRMLVVHGEHDEVVPYAAVLDWARPQQQPVLTAPGAGHFFHGMLTPLKHWVCAWHGAAAA
jgi:alpha/beta superfamily hydrolase